MKNILKFINPIYVIKRLYNCIKEIFLFISYGKSLNDMEKSGILKEHGFKRDGTYRLIKGINLQPEIKLDGGPPDSSELKRFELSFIGKEISKYNDLFLEENILELIKTTTHRVDDKQDYYGYTVSLMFNFNHLSTFFIMWSIIYTSLIVYLFSLISLEQIISILP